MRWFALSLALFLVLFLFGCTASSVGNQNDGHVAILTWIENDSSAVGFHVYRAALPSTLYVKIANTTATTYTDAPLPGTYSYAVAAVGADGHESDLSNAVTAVIP